MTFNIIAAIGRDGSLGQHGALPWGRIQKDMQWFKSLTTARHPYLMAQHHCLHPHVIHNTHLSISSTQASAKDVQNVLIMGTRTVNSLSASFVDRQIVALHQDGGVFCSAHRACHSSLDTALRCWKDAPHIFACGGTRIYEEALRHPMLQRLYITEIDESYPDADTWWPGTVEDLLWSDGQMFCPSSQNDHAWQTWTRTHMSPWITSRIYPRIRFGIWERI